MAGILVERFNGFDLLYLVVENKYVPKVIQFPMYHWAKVQCSDVNGKLLC